MQNRTQSALIICNGVMALFFISMLGYYYRLVPEDYYAVLGNHKFGLWNQAVVVCNQWGGRFISYFTSFVLLYLHEHGFSYAWYFLAGNCLLLFSFYSIISYIVTRYTLRLALHEKFASSFLVFLALFYLTPGKQESWFWAGASPSYYLGLVLAVTGAAMLCRIQVRWYHALVSSCCFFYACSASEPFALMIIFFISCGIVFSFIRKEKKPLFRLLVVFIFAAAGFLLMYFSKGTANRWMAMPELSLATKLVRWTGAGVKYFIFFFPFQVLVSLLFLPVIFAFGNRIRSYIRIPEPGAAYFFGISFLAFATIVLLGFLPSCYVMGEAGPLRSWHHTGLYVTAFFLIVYAGCGYRYGSRFKATGRFITAFLITVTCVHFIYVSWQLSVSKAYAMAVDSRMALLDELQYRGYQGTLTVDPLPDPGLLFPAEIGQEKQFFLNVFLKNGRGLDYDIVVRDKPLPKAVR